MPVFFSGPQCFFAASFSRAAFHPSTEVFTAPIFERLSMITLLGKYRSPSPFLGLGSCGNAVLVIHVCMWLPVWPSSFTHSTERSS
jgi:hypothetical protein